MAKEFPADVVLANLEGFGKYKVRVLEGAHGPTLDIREFVAGEPGKFSGFTRKGIRISKEDARVLAGALLEFEKR